MAKKVYFHNFCVFYHAYVQTETLKLISRPTKEVSFVQRPGLLSKPNESGLAAKFWCT